MKRNKLVVLLVVLITIIVLIPGWIWLQDTMIKYDIDENEEGNMQFH